jgi:hypothetical protein
MAVAEFHPPEGLRKIAHEAAYKAHAAGRFTVHQVVDAALAALFEACEVREERRIVIDDEQVTGLWLAAAWAGDCDVLAATYSSGRVERHFVIETAPEPVSSTGEEPTGG